MEDAEQAIVTPTRHWRATSPAVVIGVMRSVDAAIPVVAGLLAYAVYLPPHALLSNYLVVLAVTALLQVNLFHLAGLYRFERMRDIYHQVVRVAVAWTAVFCVLIVAAFMTKTSAEFSRGWATIWFAGVLGTLVASRFVLSAIIRTWVREGRLTRNVAVMGGGEQSQRLLATFDDADDPGVRVLGYFDDRSERVPPTIGTHALLGSCDDLIDTVRRERVDLVVLAFPWAAEDRILEILRKLRPLPVDICMATDLVGFHLPRMSVTRVGSTSVLNVYRRPLSDWSRIVKGVMDRTVAGAALLAAAPLMGAVAIAIKLESPGPVFFRQPRYGFNHRPFDVYKFRTMFQDKTDLNADRLTSPNDPRVTPLGRFLRRTSIDELPQFFNVLAGSMSVVGPRPHALGARAGDALYEEVVEEYAARHRIKPGITGWAQVNGWRGETDTAEKLRKRVEHDLYYIENWSVGLDLRIMLMTALIVIRGDNAY